MNKFYPSKPRAKTADWKGISNKANAEISLDISSPVKFGDSAVNACFDKWQKRFTDEWVNPIANIGVGNSITQYTQWINRRISYAECAFLANDSIINNAISKIANEIFRKGGKIVLENQEPDFETEFIKKLEKRIDKLKFFDVLHKAVITTLTYGGALIYIDTNIGLNNTLADPVYFKKDFITDETITNLRVIEPYLCGAVDVNSANPLNADFMIPSKWYISGAGVVDKTRLVCLSFFNAPDMLKPLYNYFGISLPQFMKDFVKIADGARQALGDIFTRFRTTILKTDLSKISAQEAMDRVGAINKLRNNLGTLLLTSDEEYVESITNLTNLDKLLSQMQENIAVSARMPAVKLLGLTPSGFNATGDFDLKSYYDEVMSYQNSIVKPIVEKFLHIFSLELGFDLYPKYEFEDLNTENALNQSQINATESQVVNNLIQSGVITQEQGFNYLQGKKIIDKGEAFDESADDFAGEFDFENSKTQNFADALEYDINGNAYFAGEGYNHSLGMSNNAVNDLMQGIKPLKYFNKLDCEVLEKSLGLKKNSIKVKDLQNALMGERYASYHHMGKKYDKVEFYSLSSAMNAYKERGDKFLGVDLSDKQIKDFENQSPKLNFANSINNGYNPYLDDLNYNAINGDLKDDELNLFKEQMQNSKDLINDYDNISTKLKNATETNASAREYNKREQERQEQKRQEQERQEQERQRVENINKLTHEVAKKYNITQEDIKKRADEISKSGISKNKKIDEFRKMAVEAREAQGESKEKALKALNLEYLSIKQSMGNVKGIQNTFLKANNELSGGGWDESKHPRDENGKFK